MYIPNENIMSDRQEALAFMQHYSFATIINTINGLPVATHLPFVVTQQGDDIWLKSHFAKANEQWQHLVGQSTLVIFSEPHAYISPQHYDRQLNVPTWNYVAVHAYGEASIIADRAAGFALIEETMLTFEASYKAQWDQLPEAYKEGMYNGIVAFEIKVTDLQAKAKLSQNKRPAEQERIIAALLASDLEVEREIGAYMQTLATKKKP